MLQRRHALLVSVVLSAPLFAQQSVHQGIAVTGPVPSASTGAPAMANSAAPGGGCTGSVIDFELGHDCLFSSHLPLRFEYQSVGVLFTGPNGNDGGAVLDQCSNFGGMNAISGTQFLAFNRDATMQNGGVPWVPETVSFNFPVSNVSAYFSGGGSTSTVTFSAFDGASNPVDSVTSVVDPSTWTQLSLNGAGIRYVVMEATEQDARFIVDDLCYTDGCAQIGTNYCGPANQNSSGGPAAIVACGSATATDNSVMLESSGMPLGQFGFFVNSQTQGFVLPPGSQGHLCLGGAIGRYNSTVLNSGATGSFSLQLDLTQTPTPAGPVSILPGETWYFTAWFRDGSSSNFSDGVGITFQ